MQPKMQPKNALFRREHFFEFRVYGLIEGQLFFFDGVLVGGLQHIVCGVAHALHTIFIGNANGQHNGGVGVTKIVKAKMRNTGFFANTPEYTI